MVDDSAESPQRWTAKRRATVVQSILKGETSAEAAARKHGLTVAEVEEWRDRWLLGAENALRARPKNADALKDEQVKQLKQKVGELGLDVDVLKEASRRVDVLDLRGKVPPSRMRACEMAVGFTGTIRFPRSHRPNHAVTSHQGASTRHRSVRNKSR